MNMMRKNNNRGGGKHRGGRRYNNSGGGGNRPNDGQNLARQKHHATQMREKYNNLVRDAQNNGDRVDVEYYLQHVDHYNRVLAGIAEIEAERFAQQRSHQQSAEGGAAEGGETQSSEGGESVDGAQADAGNAGDAGGQHRHHRHHRRHHHAPQGEDNGAREANSNTSETPLPGSILPPI